MKVVATVNTRSAALRLCQERGLERHQVLPSMGGWDVLEMNESDIARARKTYLLARAEEFERSAGVFNVLSKASKRSGPGLLKQAKDAMTRAIKLRAEAESLAVPDEQRAPAGVTLQ